MVVHMYSPDGSLDQQYIANYVGLHVRDAHAARARRRRRQQPGGARLRHAHLDRSRTRAAARSLTVDDIVAALRSHNVQVAAGAVGQPPFAAGRSAYQLNVEALGRLTTPEQFGDIIVKTDAQGRVDPRIATSRGSSSAPPTTPSTPIMN